jgi:protoporphyrinogen oxidase
LTYLLEKFSPEVPLDVISAVKNLHYRSTIVVNVIVNAENPFPDNWIYVHSPEARVGRIGNLKNWSPDVLPDKNKTALGLEYFCTEGDELWNKTETELINIAKKDLAILKIAKEFDVEDGFVAKLAKTYPVYDQEYPQNYKVVVDYIKHFENIQPIGRYGMFKYNNMDHSILAGLYAAENILGKNYDIWEINTDAEYHEEKK